jgi:hypothetical protein
LIKNEHWGHEAVALIPKSRAGAMEIRPERLLVAYFRRLDFARGARVAQGRVDLRDKRRCVRRWILVANVDIDGQLPRLAQNREKPGLEERRFAEPRLSEKYRKGLAFHEPEELRFLFVATAEVAVMVLEKLVESRPGIVWTEQDI